jgi:hypothetical protein
MEIGLPVKRHVVVPTRSPVIAPEPLTTPPPSKPATAPVPVKQPEPERV